MDLYEFYRLILLKNGKRVLQLIDNPLPKDGYSHEPLGYVDPDESAYDTIEYDVPFNGIVYSFAGDCGTVTVVEDDANIPMEVFQSETPQKGVYYQRTGIYNQDNTYTGYDAVTWFKHETESDN